RSLDFARDFGSRLPLVSCGDSFTPAKRRRLSPAGPMVLHAKVCGSPSSNRVARALLCALVVWGGTPASPTIFAGRSACATRFYSLGFIHSHLYSPGLYTNP